MSRHPDLYDLTHKKKYTLKDLEAARAMYDANFEKLLDSVGTKNQLKYNITEDRLEKLGVKIKQQVLNIASSSPCPIEEARNCFNCTGYFKPRIKSNKKSIVTTVMVMASEDDTDIIKCDVKETLLKT